MKTLILIFLLSSCAHLNEREEQRKSWIGHRIDEVGRHPIFSHFRRRDSNAGRVSYIDGGPHITKASCQALGCGALTDNWCEHHFYLNEGFINRYEQYGPCPYDPRLAPTEVLKK